MNFNASMYLFGYLPVKNKEELDSLDNKELVEGYMLGTKGEKADLGKTRGFYHGYLNGLNDFGFRIQDIHQKELITKLKETDFFEKPTEALKNFISEIAEEDFEKLYEKVKGEKLSLNDKDAIIKIKNNFFTS